MAHAADPEALAQIEAEFEGNDEPAALELFQALVTLQQPRN